MGRAWARAGATTRRRPHKVDFRHPTEMTTGTCQRRAPRRQTAIATQEAHMNNIKSASIFAALADWLTAAHAGELTVTVSDIRAPRALLQLSVSNSDDAWNNKAKPVAGQKVAAETARSGAALHVARRHLRRAGDARRQRQRQARHQLHGNSRRRLRVQQQPHRTAQGDVRRSAFPIDDSPKAIVVRLR